MRMNKEYKDFIKELMKSLNYKCRSEVYYRRVGENFVTVDFWINKESQLITYVNYKKYSHDCRHRLKWDNRPLFTGNQTADDGRVKPLKKGN